MNDDIAGTIAVGGQTITHPVGIAALALCCYFIFFHRKSIVIPALLIFIFAVPNAQRIQIISLDFSFLRIVILAALARAAFSGEFRTLQTNKADKLVFWWMLWSVIAYGFLNESLSAAMTRTGFMVDAVGAYFVGRIYVKSWSDMKQIAIFLGYASIPIVIFFLVERSTGRNIFSVFGGINEYTLVREGKLRCQGPFSHPIMAGLFWASILPWLAVVWIRREMSKPLLTFMFASMIVIILNTASSTPVMAVLLFGVGLIFFPYRGALPLLRWTALFGLVAAQIIMEKGVAHLIARVNIFSGSTGWHRYHLIDQAINHLGEWFLVGTLSTQHWGAGLEDVTNQYILEGVRGGVLGMLLFVAFLVALFQLVGRAIQVSDSDQDRWIYWCAGVGLFAHIFSFLGASYFGQMIASFFLFSGITAGLCTRQITNQIEQKPLTAP